MSDPNDWQKQHRRDTIENVLYLAFALVVIYFLFPGN